IHPYSNVAWTVLFSVYQAVEKQKETDKNIGRLIQTMADVYVFAEDIESAVSEKIKRLEKTIYTLVKQTEECALFIQEYTGHGFGGTYLLNRSFIALIRFTGRVINGLLSEDRDKIRDFTAAFQKLRESLNTETQKLTSLKPVDMNASLRPVCLPGTRQELRDLITNWLITPLDVNAVNSGNILWLSGVAGEGKSTIATSISEYFRELGRLGAFLFFTRNKSDPSYVIRTIAFQLARSNIHVASAICAAIDHNPASIDSPIQTQFQKLLLNPLTVSQSHIHGPIIVVLDALDECGNADSRRSLVSLISDEFPKLPAAVRFFITSRPDSDIASKFENQPKNAKHLLDITMPSCLTDIRIYLDNEMREIQQQQKLGSNWPGELKMEVLTKHSSGLFIWASTATKYLLQSYYPDKALESLLDKGLTTLDDLYTGALEVAGPWNDPTFVREAQAALSIVILGKTPVSVAMIDALLGLELEHSSSRIFDRLRCVLQWAPGQHVKILHTSFSDYLMDHGRSGKKPWFIDPSILELQIAHGCLRVLKNGLRFNICGFEDSYMYTTQVPDLPGRSTACISPHLLYSSLYWANHLAVTSGSDSPHLPDGLLTDLKDLMYTKFLFWLEVLCIQQKVGIAIDALEAVAKVAKSYHEETLADFAKDGVKFVIAFAPVIAHSVPHIYLSALPFAPTESKVKKQFSSFLVPSRIVNIQSSVGGHWPRLQATIKGHSGMVHSVAFSPNGNRIVSGSADKTVRVWDARTGDLIVGPFNGHTNNVRCVAFSCDGKNIVSGSFDKTVRVWDAQTGKIIGAPLTGHQGPVYLVCFSPNGKQIASASLDKTVHIWNWDGHSEGTGTVSLVIKHAASVQTVAFSPDREQVVSGSNDGLVHIWDTLTGKLITGPLKGHTQYIRSITFSPDGKYILSLSHESARIWDACMGAEIMTVTTPMATKAYSATFAPNGEQIVVGYSDLMLRIWDVQTGKLVSAPIDGHSNAVISVSVSPDGMRIVSGSSDKTICVWDAQEFSGAFKVDSQHIEANDPEIAHPVCTGHTDAVKCVAFSPKGNHIASGSWDSTVCVWDACAGTIVTGPLYGHKDRVLCIAFSPNGKHIASGSKDMTIGVWNVQNGDRVAGPFEGHTDKVWCVAFSPQGDRIVSGSFDSTVCVWDVATGWVYWADVAYDTVAFSSDGQLIASLGENGVVGIFDLRLRALTQLKGHTGIYGIAFSQDGNWIVSGSDDTTVCVWDLETKDLVAGPYEGHRGKVLSVDFSPDRRWVVSSSWDTSIRVFKVRA
ncbi:WD40-repeat-containing domain protein, partial [Rhodocollybia butyracea]